MRKHDFLLVNDSNTLQFYRLKSQINGIPERFYADSIKVYYSNDCDDMFGSIQYKKDVVLNQFIFEHAINIPEELYSAVLDIVKSKHSEIEALFSNVKSAING